VKKAGGHRFCDDFQAAQFSVCRAGVSFFHGGRQLRFPAIRRAMS
jgi:hypothetical protein